MANERRRQQRRRNQRERLLQQSHPQPATSRPGRPAVIAAVIAVVVLGAAIIGIAVVRGQNVPATRTPSASPTATTGSTIQPTSPAVDGVQCAAMEQVAYHIHQHVSLYENGQSVTLPANIGIPGGEQSARCFYWIHVHSFTPGIIHVESPVSKTFTLGNFFDIWAATQNSTIPPQHVHLSRVKAAAARGQLTAFYNGNLWHGSYRSIPLTAHAVITIEIGNPIVPPKPFSSWAGL